MLKCPLTTQYIGRIVADQLSKIMATINGSSLPLHTMYTFILIFECQTWDVVMHTVENCSKLLGVAHISLSGFITTHQILSLETIK